MMVVVVKIFESSLLSPRTNISIKIRDILTQNITEGKKDKHICTYQQYLALSGIKRKNMLLCFDCKKHTQIVIFTNPSA